MQLSGKYSVAFFAVAVIDLAVITECMRAHVPVNYAFNPMVALVEILFLSLMGMNAAGAHPFDNKIAVTLPLPSESQEVAKRIERFGLDGEHPQLTRANWMRAIANDQTQDSYWAWVTKNEILAQKLLDLPGMRTTRSTEKPAGKFAGLTLLRGKNQA